MTAALMALGYNLNHTGDRKCLDHLTRCADPAYWRNLELNWRAPFPQSPTERNHQLANLAVLGLALSSSPEAALFNTPSPNPDNGITKSADANRRARTHHSCYLGSMSDSESRSTAPSLRQSLGLDRHPLTRSKYLALGAAILMMILGVGITLTPDRAPALSSPGPSDSSRPESGLLGHGFAQTRPSTTGDASGSVSASGSTESPFDLRDLSPFMVKGGFGLFVGFAIGFAIRAFLRLAIVIVGFYLLVLGMMAYAGLIEIRWNLMDTQFTNLLSFLAGQFESIKTFLTGAIPASSLTALGFVVGLRRK